MSHSGAVGLSEGPRPRLKGRKARCGVCAEYFNSPAAFDKHRTGEYTQRSPGYGRRCLSPEEMLLKGMVKTVAGYWVTEPMRKGRF